MMGVPGLWEEIKKVSPGREVLVAKLAAEFFEVHKRPMKIAIDTPIAIFSLKRAIQAAEAAKKKEWGGMNHVTRTFYYQILHLLRAGVLPLFVFDGPQKPAEKGTIHPTNLTPCRHVRGEGPHQRTKVDEACETTLSHINGLCRQVLLHLGIPCRDAPGEGEAECAALEKAGIVDAVMTRDGDAFIFGARRVLQRRRADDQDAYACQYLMDDLKTTAQRPGLRWQDLFLLAMMGGGDYHNGIPGRGPAAAIQAARAGFAGKLEAVIRHGGEMTLAAFREELVTALERNEKEKFTQRFQAVARAIPRDFPNKTIANHYLKPVVSPDLSRPSVEWVHDCSLYQLREWTRVFFDWQHAALAGKFMRVLAVPLLVKQLVAHITKNTDGSNLICQLTAEKEDERGVLLRVVYQPCQVVNIDISHEVFVEGFSSNLKKPFDPQETDKEWIPQWIIEYGAPKAFHRWQTAQQQQKQARKRKPTVAENSIQATEPKRQRGRPGKVSVTVGPTNSAALKRTQGRPRKTLLPLPVKQPVTQKVTLASPRNNAYKVHNNFSDSDDFPGVEELVHRHEKDRIATQPSETTRRLGVLNFSYNPAASGPSPADTRLSFPASTDRIAERDQQTPAGIRYTDFIDLTGD